MAKIPQENVLQAKLTAGFRPGEVQLLVERLAGWKAPTIFVDMPAGASLGKPVLQWQGEGL